MFGKQEKIHKCSFKSNLTDSPFCHVVKGSPHPTTYHDPHTNMFYSFVNIINAQISFELLFFGKNELDNDINMALVLTVQTIS